MGKRIRVLFFLSSLAGGGAERNTLNLLKVLNRSKYDGHLGLIRAEGPLLEEVPGDIEIVELQSRAGQPLNWVPIPAGKGFLKTAVLLRRIVDCLEPDVLLSNMPETSLPTSLVRHSHHKRSFRWIVTEHNDTNTRLEQVIANRTKRLILRRWIQVSYSVADHVIAVSEGVKRGLAEHFGISPTNMTVIHNPMDISRIQKEAKEPISFPWPEEQVILGVGKLKKQKGFDILIRAFAEVRRKVFARLIVLGSGELKGELEALAHRLGVEDYVTLVGFVSNPWAYMARSDAFVLSSRWEGFGNVIVEAMACGTPVIAADCDYGPGEIITHGKNGLLVPVEDVESLAETTCRLLEDREMAKSLKQEGYRRALDFDSKKICSQYEDVFKKVVEHAAG